MHRDADAQDADDAKGFGVFGFSLKALLRHKFRLGEHCRRFVSSASNKTQNGKVTLDANSRVGMASC